MIILALAKLAGYTMGIMFVLSFLAMVAVPLVELLLILLTFISWLRSFWNNSSIKNENSNLSSTVVG